MTRPASLWTALLGWLCLLSGAGLYALVTLSPRLVQWEEVSRNHFAIRQRLTKLYAQTESMDALISELESNPRVIEEIARTQLRIRSPYEETIPVDARLEIRLSLPHTADDLDRLSKPWYLSWIQHLAQDATLRYRWMVLTGLLCIIPFVCFRSDTPLAHSRQAARSTGSTAAD